MTRVLNLKSSLSLFLDTPKVMKQLSETERRSFTRMGGFIKTNAQRRQLKKRKTPSTPGNPPHVRYGEKERPSLKWILFFYDPKKHEVIVGPVGVRSKLDPGVLEKGGSSVSYRRYLKNARPRRSRSRSRPLSRSERAQVHPRDERGRFKPGQKPVGSKKRTRTDKPPTIRRQRPKKIALAPRPFMFPALEAEMPKIKPLMERL